MNQGTSVAWSGAGQITKDNVINVQVVYGNLHVYHILCKISHADRCGPYAKNCVSRAPLFGCDCNQIRNLDI